MGKGGKGESKQKEWGDGERRDYSEPFGAQDRSECLCSLCDGRTAAWLDGYGVSRQIAWTSLLAFLAQPWASFYILKATGYPSLKLGYYEYLCLLYEKFLAHAKHI